MEEQSKEKNLEATENNSEQNFPVPKKLKLSKVSLLYGLVSFLIIPLYICSFFIGISAATENSKVTSCFFDIFDSPYLLLFYTIPIIVIVITFITAGISIVTGIISIAKIVKSKNILVGKGKAICGIIMGILAILISAFTILILDTHERAKAKQCSLNLEIFGGFVLYYADSHNGMLPRSVEELKHFVEGKHLENNKNMKWKTLHCPEKESSPYDLLPSAKGMDMNKIEDCSKTPIAVCKSHPNREYHLYADGHVEFKVTGTTW